jgi:PncC family amidohydrolase
MSDLTTDAARLRAAVELAECLARRQLRLVLAESCTAGNVAGALAIVPGISAWLCGSFVIYRNESKADWLQIPRTLLDDPSIGPVSQEVTELLARQALAATHEADIGVAVTGHIGPGSPEGLDGRAWFALARRSDARVAIHTRLLESPPPGDQRDYLGRQRRLHECTCWVLRTARQTLDGVSGTAEANAVKNR